MTRAWRLARIVGSRGGVVYAWARRPGVLRMWEVALESGAVVSARATPDEDDRGMLILGLVEDTLAGLRQRAARGDPGERPGGATSRKGGGR